jgi:acetyl esterase/lipase
MFNFMMRNRHLFQGKLRKEKYDMNTSIQGFRDQCEKGAARLGKIPRGITVREQTILGIRSEWLVPDGTDKEKLILYVHGGGYVSGSCSDHRGIIAKFAKRTGYTNLIYEYGLAPERPFPAAVDDSVGVYQWLFDSGYKPDSVLVAGESAGGGLVLALLLALRERKIPMPAAAVSISPWTDLTWSSDSYWTKNKMSLAPMDSWFVFGKHYVGDNDPKNPLISPLFGDLKGLPPVFINSGEDDELFEDGEKFYLKAKEAGVDITFRAGKNMVHCYPLLDGFFPEATGAMQEIADFINKHIGKR